MIQVQLARRNGKRHVVGPRVRTLRQARLIVKALDAMHAARMLPPRWRFYSPNTLVEAVSVTSGRSWSYADSDPSGWSDGVWFRQ